MTHSAYIVAAEPRSGSNLLAEALLASGRAGDPDEWFNEAFLHQRLLQYGVADPHSTEARPIAADGRAYLERLIAETGSGGWFGLKIHQHQYRAAIAARIGDVFDHLQALTGDPFVIRLTRRDVVRQAISTYLAAYSGVYYDRSGHAPAERIRMPSRYWLPGSPPGPEPSGEPPPFDLTEIDAIVSTIERDEAAWDRLITGRGLSSIAVTYEDLVEHRERTLSTVFAALGIAVPPLARPTFQRQAGGLTEEFVRAYAERKAGR
jgi:LPS sulfotransferase NodH